MQRNRDSGAVHVGLAGPPAGHPGRASRRIRASVISRSCGRAWNSLRWPTAGAGPAIPGRRGAVSGAAAPPEPADRHGDRLPSSVAGGPDHQ